jgi:hypothetical protein
MHRAQVLRTDYNVSPAATLELSLASPTFRNLGGPELGVVAFFPQGVDGQNLNWLFPTIPDRRNIFDNGFVTTLAPIRDYDCPRDPQSSPLLCQPGFRSVFGRCSPRHGVGDAASRAIDSRMMVYSCFTGDGHAREGGRWGEVSHSDGSTMGDKL